MTQKTESWKLSRLEDHSLQSKYFPEAPAERFAALKTAMARGEILPPVHVLPDGTILAGHSRVKAARELGRKTIDVVVRHDLAEAGPEATLEFLLADNQDRRQLSKLDEARC